MQKHPTPRERVRGIPEAEAVRARSKVEDGRRGTALEKGKTKWISVPQEAEDEKTRSGARPAGKG